MAKTPTAGKHTEIAELFGIGQPSVGRIYRRFMEEHSA